MIYNVSHTLHFFVYRDQKEREIDCRKLTTTKIFMKQNRKGYRNQQFESKRR